MVGDGLSITHDSAYYLLFIMLLCSNEDEVNRKDRQKRKRKLPVDSQEGVVVVSYDSCHSDNYYVKFRSLSLYQKLLQLLSLRNIL